MKPHLSTLVLGAIVAATLLTGCRTDGLDPMAAYDPNEEVAARQAAADYVAGVAALRRHDLPAAERLLRKVAAYPKSEFAPRARYELGLAYADQRRFDLAAPLLEQAAAALIGQDRAQAYYHAGAARQNLAQWDQARADLQLAISNSDDPNLRRSAAELSAVRGYTLQLAVARTEAVANRSALELAPRLAAQNLGPARITTTVDLDGHSWYVVEAGTFSRFEDADQARKRLDTAGAVVTRLKDAAP